MAPRREPVNKPGLEWSLNRPKWERLPYFETGISVVKKIELTFVTGAGKRSAFSKH